MRTPIALALLAFAAPGLAVVPPAKTTLASAKTTAASAKTTAAPAKTTIAPVKEAWDQTAPRAVSAWVRPNPVPGRPSAGYLTINGGGQPDSLTGATAPGVRIEMHSMTMAGGIMAMAKLDRLPVPAGGSVAFAPGGNHLMIFGMAAGAKTLPIMLSFASGKTATLVADVRSVTADPHAGH